MRAEVFRLDREVYEATLRSQAREEERDRAFEAYTELARRNEERLDRLAEQQTEILEMKLGLGDKAIPQAEHPEMRPIGGRRAWSKVANEFEKKQRIEASKQTAERADHWKKKIDAIEKQDAK